jgi:hypothetical protein
MNKIVIAEPPAVFSNEMSCSHVVRAIFRAQARRVYRGDYRKRLLEGDVPTGKSALTKYPGLVVQSFVRDHRGQLRFDRGNRYLSYLGQPKRTPPRMAVLGTALSLSRKVTFCNDAVLMPINA